MDTAHGELGKDLRDYVALEAERMAAEITGVKRLQDDLGVRADAAQNDGLAVQEQVDQLSHALSEARSNLIRLGERLEEAQGQNSQQANELEKKISETDGSLRSCIEACIRETKTSFHSWVETNVVNRVTSLDRGLRTEMDERSSAIQQVVSKVSHNAERWCQLQAKFDEILVEMHRANRPAVPPGGEAVDRMPSSTPLTLRRPGLGSS
mmetsp:Transcript_87908/g.233362  ORF Transcript_87908/g.233362 Transcript_87908/m.233362 type:complete len:209 (-) Transcript_87908:115-741(-)